MESQSSMPAKRQHPTAQRHKLWSSWTRACCEPVSTCPSCYAEHPEKWSTESEFTTSGKCTSPTIGQADATATQIHHRQTTTQATTAAGATKATKATTTQATAACY